MNLDDRLRRAHQNQMDDVRRRVDVEASRRSITDRRTSTPGAYLVAAAAAILLLGGGGVLLRNAVSSVEQTVEVEAGTVGESTGVSRIDSSAVGSDDAAVTDNGLDQTEPTTGEPSDADPAVTVSVPEAGPGETDQTDSGPADQPATAPTTSATETSDASAVPAAGVANSVCPSGQRAELELAALRYVGENQGWGRLFDLVDEQDGPHYYQAWEPGYPDPVTVEVILADPVMATEIRLAQDPFTPVDGDILIEAAGQQIAITLEGTEGWKQHVFAQPTRLDRFTIGRSSVTSNIMEVLVCVVSPD